MKQKKCDSDKLIDDYHNQIKRISEQNSHLTDETNQLKKTIVINHEILSSLLPKPNTLILEMQTEIRKYYALLDKKSQLINQTNQYESIVSNLPLEIESMRNENNQLKKNLEIKVKQIEKLQKAIKKQRKQSMLKEPNEEVYVIEPTAQVLSEYNMLLPYKEKNKHQNGIERKTNKSLSPKQGSGNSNGNTEYKTQIQMLQIAIMGIEAELVKIRAMTNSIGNSISFSNGSNKGSIRIANDSFSDRRGDTNGTNESSISYEDNNDNNIEIDNVNQLNYSIENNSTPLDGISIKEEIERLKKEKERLLGIDLRYKEDIINYETSYEKMKNDIHHLTKLIQLKTDDTNKHDSLQHLKESISNSNSNNAVK